MITQSYYYMWQACATHFYEAMIDITCAPWRQQLCTRFKTNNKHDAYTTLFDWYKHDAYTTLFDWYKHDAYTTLFD